MLQYRKLKNQKQFPSFRKEGRMERENKEILDATMQVFNEKGLKFTMDDVARELGMSKKTIYGLIKDKNTLFLEMVDYCFDTIKEEEQSVLEDATLDIEQKIRRILSVLPESYESIDLRKLYQLKDKYPKIYQKVEERLENGWETTITLLEQGMEEGVIRKIPIPILKTMFEASLEQFFRRDILMANDISYGEALKQLVEILMYGITERK